MIEGSRLSYYLVPILKIWLFMFFLLICTIPFVLITQLRFLPAISYPLVVDVLTQLSLVSIVLGALLMMFKVFSDLDFYSVFIRRSNLLPEFFKGVGMGILLMMVCASLLYASGNVRFEMAGLPWLTLGLYVIYFVLIAVFEELLFRSYPLFALAERYPIWFAILANGLLFAFAHFANPGVTVLGLVNITLAGILFALYTLQKRNVSWAIGIHFSWNFTQAVVLGYKVSGNEMSGLVKAIPQGPAYLSGGKFGIEGSLYSTFFLIAIITWLYYRNGLPPLESSTESSEKP